jgi:hypothetical protein
MAPKMSRSLCNSSPSRLSLKQGAKAYAEQAKSSYGGSHPSSPKANRLSEESVRAARYACWKFGPVRPVSVAISLSQRAAVSAISVQGVRLGIGRPLP